MSDMAKQARAAMKAKAKSLTSADPHQKVDSSTWSPPEALNADIKTGMRPLSRRAFKAGGKVQGVKAKANLGKATRGGNKPITPDTMANKDVKAANMDRPGIKHVGGMKKGGVACKEEGGVISSAMKRIRNWATNVPEGYGQKPTESKPAPTTSDVSEADKAKLRGIIERDGQKKGGRAKKAGGGDLEAYGKGVSGAAEMMKKAAGRAGVPGGLYGAGFQRVGAGKLSPMSATGMTKLKKGGVAEKHTDEKMDIALIKKMVKPEARTKRKEGGGVFSGPSYPGKIPGVVPGGREARATGGKTRAKGKTNINILISAGKPADGMMGGMPGGPTKPPGMDGGPGGVPVPVPPPQAGGMPGGMPMPMPMPMPAAGGAPGGMPTPRKDGGRLTKVASSYKDMEAGAGGGEGRLQKTDIAKKHKDAPAFRKGGKVYRSYKDMDAGAGSGLGRLEKTEIQARKG